MELHGTFWWNELMTHDVERAKAFYGKTVGWTFEEWPHSQGAPYWIIKIGEKTVGGMFDLAGTPGCEAMPEGWLAYVAVDDVDARTEAAITAGAKLMRPIFDIPMVGRVALLREPGGAEIAWATPVAQDRAKSPEAAGAKTEPTS